MLYRSCLDLSGNIEALGADPLRAVIADVGGWSLSGPGVTKGGGGRFSLRQKLRAVQRYNSNALFHWYVREGMYNTSQYELFIHQGAGAPLSSIRERNTALSHDSTFTGGITLPSKELYGHSNSKSASAFFKYFSSVVSLLNEGMDDRPNNAREIRDVIDLERQLAGIMAREDNMTGMFVTIDKVGWSNRRRSEDRTYIESLSYQTCRSTSGLLSAPTGEAGGTSSTTSSRTSLRSRTTRR